MLIRAAMYTQGSIILDSVVAPLIEEARKTDMALANETGPAMTGPPGGETEKDRILRVLQKMHWHYGKTCKSLRISRPTLTKKMDRYGIAKKR